MKVSRELDLCSFEFWAGAKDHCFTDSELKQIQFILEEIHPDGLDETTINDLFWFEENTLCEWIGVDFYEDYLKRD